MNCETCNATLPENTMRSCCDECESRELAFREQAAALGQLAIAVGQAAANAHEAGVRAGLERERKMFTAIGINLPSSDR
jgi:hypothetical protein